MAFQVQPLNPPVWCPAIRSVLGSTKAINIVTGSNYVGNQGTIGRDNGWRADRQKPPRAMANIQIQKDGVDPPSTCACVLIPIRYAEEMGSLNHPDPKQAGSAVARHKELTRRIWTALDASRATHRAKPGVLSQWEIQVFEIIGEFSS